MRLAAAGLTTAAHVAMPMSTDRRAKPIPQTPGVVSTMVFPHKFSNFVAYDGI
jgi:hypothetical protein